MVKKKQESRKGRVFGYDAQKLEKAVTCVVCSGEQFIIGAVDFFIKSYLG